MRVRWRYATVQLEGSDMLQGMPSERGAAADGEP